jgi:hypothetical protein
MCSGCKKGPFFHDTMFCKSEIDSSGHRRFLFICNDCAKERHYEVRKTTHTAKVYGRPSSTSDDFRHLRSVIIPQAVDKVLNSSHKLAVNEQPLLQQSVLVTSPTSYAQPPTSPLKPFDKKERVYVQVDVNDKRTHRYVFAMGLTWAWSTKRYHIYYNSKDSARKLKLSRTFDLKDEYGRKLSEAAIESIRVHPRPKREIVKVGDSGKQAKRERGQIEDSGYGTSGCETEELSDDDIQGYIVSIESKESQKRVRFSVEEGQSITPKEITQKTQKRRRSFSEDTFAAKKHCKSNPAKTPPMALGPGVLAPQRKPRSKWWITQRREELRARTAQLEQELPPPPRFQVGQKVFHYKQGREGIIKDKPSYQIKDGEADWVYRLRWNESNDDCFEDEDRLYTELPPRRVKLPPSMEQKERLANSTSSTLAKDMQKDNAHLQARFSISSSDFQSTPEKAKSSSSSLKKSPAKSLALKAVASSGSSGSSKPASSVHEKSGSAVSSIASLAFSTVNRLCSVSYWNVISQPQRDQ